MGEHGATEPPQAASAVLLLWPVSSSAVGSLKAKVASVTYLTCLPSLPPSNPTPAWSTALFCHAQQMRKGLTAWGGRGRGGGQQRSRQRKQHEQGSQHG